MVIGRQGRWMVWVMDNVLMRVLEVRGGDGVMG